MRKYAFFWTKICGSKNTVCCAIYLLTECCFCLWFIFKLVLVLEYKQNNIYILLCSTFSSWSFYVGCEKSKAWLRHICPGVVTVFPCWNRVTIKAYSHIACRVHAVPLPCRTSKGLECLSHLIYTVRPCLIHTCHPMPMPRPCRSPAMPCR